MRGRWLRIDAIGFGRRRQVDGASVGPGASPASSATSRQCPPLSFVTTPREARPRRRSPVLERLAPAAFASAFTLAPACSCSASRSRCSAAFVLNGARGLFMEWRDELAQKSVRQADYAWTVLARILSVALKRGKIDVNPCVAGERLYRSARVDKVWSEDDEAAFLRSAPAHLHLPLLLALWTGQREGDLLRLSWSAYDSSVIRLRPRKTITRKSPQGRTVIIPVGVLAQEGAGEASPLKAALDVAAREKKSPIVLLTSEGRPWTEGGFRASFNKARDKAGIVGLTFHDLRGTAVTRLALMGVEVPEIASITAHSLKDVQAILDAHYLHRDPQLAWNAIRKLEMGYARKMAAGGGAA
jgi:integrase